MKRSPRREKELISQKQVMQNCEFMKKNDSGRGP